jgi:SAM-dependent methyltransferase
MDYENNYHNVAHENLFKSESYYKLRARLSFFKYFSKIKNIKEKKILEYGAGMGQNIFLLKDNAAAYDLSDFALNFCEKKGIQVIRELKPIRDNSFDVILSSHVIEHVDNPLETLKTINKKLKKGGVFILIIPKEPQAKSELAPELRNYHLYSWNFRSINNLLHHAGFKVFHNKTFYGTAFNKLSFLSKISFKLYYLATYLVGRLFGAGELVIYSGK